jgi:hypothetical protein
MFRRSSSTNNFHSIGDSIAFFPGLGIGNDHIMVTVVANVSKCLCDHMQCTGSYIDVTQTLLVNCYCICHSEGITNFNGDEE